MSDLSALSDEKLGQIEAELEAGLIDEAETLAEELTGHGPICPFCGHDPYHYVDVGVGSVRAAVVCCEHGIALYQHEDEGLARAAERLAQAGWVITRLLSRLHAAEAGWRVKPLEWTRGVTGMRRAASILGVYNVWTHAGAQGQWFWSAGHLPWEKIVGSEEEGMAAVEAHYAAAIRSAILSPQPLAEERGNATSGTGL